MKRSEFRGRNAQEAKRIALDYWYAQRTALGLSLSQFFAQCRAVNTGQATCITFYPPAPASAVQGRTAA